MTGGLLVAAAIAAALLPGEVRFLDTGTGATIGRAALPAEGLAAFAAPDGRVVVPLAGEDATAVASRTGRIERWPGRLFPLFFVEPDRMYALMPGLLATLSYPERLPLARVPLPGVSAVRRAGCSADGRLVAIVPAGEGRALLLAAGLDRTPPSRVALTADAAGVALAPDGTFVVVVAESGVLQLAAPGAAAAARAFDVGGRARAAAVTADGRLVLVGVAEGESGEVVGLRVDRRGREPLRVHSRLRLPGAPVALAVGADEAVVVLGDRLLVLDAVGRRLRREIPLAGVADVALLPDRARSTVPNWSDRDAP